MSNNLTPKEVAIIRLKAELGKAPVEYNLNESVAYEIGYTQGYITAATEYAAEIKRLREGIESPIWFARWKDENYFTIKVNDINCYLPKAVRRTEIYLSIDQVYETFKQQLANPL